MVREVRVGQLVISKAGRDKDRPYLVLQFDGSFVFLADGSARRVENPKRKNVKHIIPTQYLARDVLAKLEAGLKVSNREVQKAIEELLASWRQGG
ncbi:MAG: KOW domain-containing RNA-binding protein [Clostridia bacterium]|nr:KOW domain-containing RNA-binding protein [Clostridia bacterium]